MTTSKNERERVREAMSKSLAASPDRQREIAEMVRNQLGAGERKHEQSNAKKEGNKKQMAFTTERRYPRAKVSIPVKWGTAPNCGYEGVITILGLGGCLINAPLYASRGQAVFVRMSLNGEGQGASVLRGHVKLRDGGHRAGSRVRGANGRRADYHPRHHGLTPS